MTALSVAAVLWAPSRASAQIYSNALDGEIGSVVLSNFASSMTPQLLLRDNSGSDESVAAPLAPHKAVLVSTRTLAVRAPSVELKALIDGIAREVRVSPVLIHAVIAQESNFDQGAVSAKGALGLMQLLPQTASRFGVRRAFDPRENITAGALYLRWLADKFDNRLDLVLAAYNAGEQTVVRAGCQVPAYPETQNYVRRIMSGLRCSGLALCSSVATGFNN